LHETFKAARDFLLHHREDYDSAYAGFQWPTPDHFNWALDWFDALARGERREQTALWLVSDDGAETKLSFHQLSQRSSQIANFLRDLGVRRRDHILLMLGNVAALWETMLAAMKLGAVVIPSSGLLTRAELADRIARGGVRHIISAAESTAKFESVSASLTRIVVEGTAPGWHNYQVGYSKSSTFEPEVETRASDPLQLYFTSGTTSKPKLVQHTHASYPIGHLSTMYWLGLRPGDVHCNLSSPGWAKHAWSCFFAPWNAEATVFVFQQQRFDARRMLNALRDYAVTSFCAPPTVWRLLAKENISSWRVRLREAASAGEPLNPEVIEQVCRGWGITIRDGYGQTETTAQIGNSPGQPIKPGAMGRPLPGYRIQVLDPEGREAAEGELCLRLEPSPLGLTPGCRDHPRSGTSIIEPVYRTGDVVSVDDDGYVTFIGRTDDIFKSSDYRISPFELESALVEHPAVVECAVIPFPDAVRTSVPKAVIVLRAGVEPSYETALSIFRHIRKVLAPYKRVRRLEFADLPKTTSGKIRRAELRLAEAQRAAVGSRASCEFCEGDFSELR
jgi:acetyl-CoA synthetase